MTLLTEDKVRAARDASSVAFEISDALILFAGGFYGLKDGRVQVFADVAGNIPLGVARRAGVGDTSAAVPPQTDFQADGFVLPAEDVTGASAITDVGKLVYIVAADNDVLTLTAPLVANPIAFGWIRKFNTSSSFDVEIFPLSQRLQYGQGNSVYAVTNHTPDKAYDADTVAVAELADVVGSLLIDLIAEGIVSGTVA